MILRNVSSFRSLTRAPVHSIEEAIAIMTAIDERLPDSDGVKWFNRLYLRVTVSVGAAVGRRDSSTTRRS